ncbi:MULTISPECIES: response regulator [Bacillales]|uniref:response regulator n=1 Tax=Bacillales TaxID=1385 RepID=UPI000178A868|nr:MULTISPECIES: response regulator transcription factor [Paenibacillus]ACX65888.1 two component transcriptional regulator, LuxR family [Paenibacillus sp. Y412MC10]EGG34804.1 putative nitrate/nitrite response regulator protein NarL [Paenibacillus sp. HGF5]ETT67133.1 LuxR family two component transcriptional regulator [Paenibacillus sp. FSL H8-457]MCM3258354.1 response regulator transcription factor [Paenibacillus lautus]
MNNQPFRVLIIDDSDLAREGIRTILSSDPTFEVVAEGQSGEDALELTEIWMPDIILMDIQMPGMGGLEATKRVKDKFPYVKIVMVTVSDDIAHLFDALKRGAQGYLLKNLNPESWHEYLKAIAVDEAPVSRELAFRILKEFSQYDKPDPSKSPLTAREKEILGLVAEGLSNRDISSDLCISENTVKNHLKNILQKLHLENRVQLTRYAFEQGWMGKRQR